MKASMKRVDRSTGPKSKKVILALVCAGMEPNDEGTEGNVEVPCMGAIVCADNARYVCTDRAQSIHKYECETDHA